MWSPRAGRRGISLAGQFLVLQVTVLLAVLAVSAVVSVRQSDADFRETRGARLRAAAENLAGTSAVRTGLRADTPPASLASYTQRTQTIYNASAVYLARPDGTVVAARGSTWVTARSSRSGPGPVTSTTAATTPWPRRCRCCRRAAT